MLAVGCVALGGCVALFAFVPSAVVLSGWSDYGPLPGTGSPGVLYVDSLHRWAAALGLVGLGAASWAAGFLAGRRKGLERVA